jgi:hypothetical protein
VHAIHLELDLDVVLDVDCDLDSNLVSTFDLSVVRDPA